ncbi:MAG: L,D-transpeptidase family protein, partial [Anaerolineae bacterium]|nr:L,D-transpeptidase family protein [Anaerolineae bacterium]
QRYGTNVSELVAANGIVNASRIYAGQVLRLSGTESVVPGSGAKQIVVNLSQQRLYAYQGDQLVYDFVISSGTAPYYTRTGTFQVQSKFPNAYGSAWNIWMPYWMGIYWAGSSENGIHALPVLSNGQTLWAGYLGRPVSYGCVVVGTYEAKLLFEWTPLGTPVQITY